MKYQLPKLSYSYEALEPYIDAKTVGACLLSQIPEPPGRIHRKLVEHA